MKTILSKFKKWKSKKAAADLISIIVSVVIISALVLGILLFLSNKVRSTAMDEINNTMNTITGIAEANRNNTDIVIPGGPGGEPIIPPEQSTGSYYFNAYSMSIYDEEPSTPLDGDAYLQGDYFYGYSSEHNGWNVHLATTDIEEMLGLSTLFPDYEWTDHYQTSYDAILESINDKPIISLFNTFQYCSALKEAPAIPNSVTDMRYTFWCCTSLEKAPAIPSSVTDMYYTFDDCTSLTEAPVIPNSVTNMESTFGNCTSLTGEIEINATNLTDYTDCFHRTEKPIKIVGSTPYKAELAATTYNGNVTY